MSAGGGGDNNNGEWEMLWREYGRSLDDWGRIFDDVVRANSEMRARFGAVMEKAAKESDMDVIKRFGENWQKALSDAGLESAAKELEDFWKGAGDRPDGDGLMRFAESWQKSVAEGGLEQIRAYGEAMKKFAETWNAMWPQK